MLSLSRAVFWNPTQDIVRIQEYEHECHVGTATDS